MVRLKGKDDRSKLSKGMIVTRVKIKEKVNEGREDGIRGMWVNEG